MSRTIEFDSEAIQPVTSIGGGVYATRRGRKSVDASLAKDQTSQTTDEENGSIIEKDVLDKRDVRRKQVLTWTTSAGDPTANHHESVVWKMANVMVSYEIFPLQVIVCY
jgi:hypothetical protein